MNTRIRVINKGSNAKPSAHVCPWVMDIPPEAAQK